MKKIFSILILISFFAINSGVALSESLPELPNLPPDIEFDTVEPPENMDVFAPASTPSPTVTNTSTKPIQQTSTIKVTPIDKNNSTTQKATGTSVPSTTTSKANTNTKHPTNTVASTKTTSQQSSSKTIKKGKKFKVVLANSVSSSTPTGTKVTFKSIYPETSTYITIPAGTVFYGQVTNSHPPQITGNGGLIEINVGQMVYKGKTYPIDAKVSVANHKRVFFNNIKGQRMYFKSIPITIRPGSRYYSKMWKVTKRLASNESGVEIILTPFSFTAGCVVYIANVAISPVLAIFYKGKSITIPANSQFTIQLREDASL